jgi:uncharacterized OsmC-like protein
MTTATASVPATPVKAPRHGVNTPALLETINAVGRQPELGAFQFRATNRWREGTASVGRFEAFYGAGTEHRHTTEVLYDFDHPKVLVGEDRGPTPVEFLLIALAGCLTAGIGNIAAVRGVTLQEVTASVTGDIDIRGILGLAKDVRNGYSNIRVAIDIKGDGPADKLREIVEQSKARSAVYDMLTNGTVVHVDVNA